MEPKRYGLASSEIKQLTPGRGSCVASDMITVHREKVGYMYRVMPSRHSTISNLDSGWAFLSGTESQDYLDEPQNLAIYDVNTIANYDADIIPLLDAPFGSAFVRDLESGHLVPTEPPAEE